MGGGCRYWDVGSCLPEKYWSGIAVTGPSVSVDVPSKALKIPTWIHSMAKFDVKTNGLESP